MAIWNPTNSDLPARPDGDNLGFVPRRHLVEPTHPPLDERRDSPRYGIAGQGLPVQVACPAGEHYLYRPGLIVDVSMYGAALLCDGLTGKAPRIYLRVLSSEKSEWLNAQVVSFQTTPRGPDLLGLHFPDGCPYEIFKAVLKSHFEEDKKSRHQPSSAQPPA